MTGALIGVEALVRWQDTDGTMVPPDDFIWLAERSDLIHPLTRFVLDRAITDAARWNQAGQPIRVAVNLSARNLAEDDLVATIKNLLAQRSLPPRFLEVELTETTVMANPAQSAQVMDQLSAIGVLISSTTLALAILPLLLDHAAGAPAEDRPLVHRRDGDRAVRRNGRPGHSRSGTALGLSVVAEGVETATAAERLRRMSCPIAQGYLYSRPLALPDLDRWMHERRTGHFAELTA